MYLLKKGDKAATVPILKRWLNEVMIPTPDLDANEDFNDKTYKAVISLKVKYGLSNAHDGVVDAETWAALARQAGLHARASREANLLPRWLYNLLKATPVVSYRLRFNHDVFLGMYVEQYGLLSTSQRDGLTQLLQFIGQDENIKDLRWAAYMLATVKHECANKWQPIEEYGKGAGHEYGKPVTVTVDGKTYTNTYYGRGYVQLTWKNNYEKMSKALGLGNDLLIRPARALEPTVAYNIMSHGMRQGSFTGKKLSDYLTGGTTDYKNARRIINGQDQWARIKDYAEELEAMLTASLGE